jgi:hypothetical protein
MTKGETRRLEAKIKEFDEIARPSDLWLARKKRGFRKTMKYIFNWYFFYKGKDRAEHIIMVFIIDLIILRIFGVI